MNYLQDSKFRFHKEPTLYDPQNPGCCVWCPDFCLPRIAIQKKSAKNAKRDANVFLNNAIAIYWTPNRFFWQGKWATISSKAMPDERAFPPTWIGLEPCITY